MESRIPAYLAGIAVAILLLITSNASAGSAWSLRDAGKNLDVRIEKNRLLAGKDASSRSQALVFDSERWILSGFTGESEIGPGGSLGAFIEWSGTAATSYAESTGGGLGSSAGSIGALYGEWGVGIGVSAGYRRLFQKDFLTVMVGLSFRLPFGAG